MTKIKLTLRLRKTFGNLSFTPSLYDGHAFRHYKEGEINLSITEQIVLNQIDRTKGDIFIPELIELLDVPDFPDIYYNSDFSRPRKVKVTTVESWSVGFTFSSFDKYAPLFTPVIYPEGEIDERKAVSLFSDFFQNNNYLYTMIEGRIHLFDRDPLLAELIKVFKHREDYNMSQAQETLDNFQMQGIKTEDHFPVFEYRELNSRPILELSRGRRNEVHLILFFEYETYQLPFRNSEESIILEKTRDRITFSRRDMGFEQAICSRCLYTFGETIQTKIYGAVRHYNFALNISGEEFLARYGETLLNYGIELKRKGDKKNLISRGKLSFQIKAFILSEEEEDPVELNKDFLEQNYYVSGNKGYYIIDQTEIKQLKSLYGLGLDKEGVIRTNRNNIGVINLIYNTLQEKDSNSLIRLKELRNRIDNFDIRESVDISKKFQGELRDYQQAGVNWFHFLHRSGLNGCLADDMGLGKTVQTLAFLQNLYDSGELKRVLIVAPVSTLPNWEHEIHRFTPRLSCLKQAGPDRTTSLEELKTPTITLISYQTLRNDILHFKKINYSYVILDEAQYIKNASTQAFKSVRILQSEHRLSLTGTPVENCTMDLWSQMDFLNPGLLGKTNIFQKRFILPIEEDQDEEKIDLLRKIVYPFILRRKKEDVLDDLPPRAEIIRYTEMAPDQAALYEQLLDKYREEILQITEEKGIGGARFDILQALMRLRQVVLFPAMLGEEYKKISSRKFDVLKLHLKDIASEDHKVIIFSQFVKSLTIMREWLDDEQIEYSYLDGSTKDRKSEIDAFQEDPNRKVFLISLKAGGTGINLTAADYVIIFDPWWNPAAEAQAIDRTHRIGQTRPVTAFRLIMKDTIEEKILELQKRKKELMNDLVVTEESIFKSITKKDLEELFKIR
jgi:superfamily II DNA or RNA helicase